MSSTSERSSEETFLCSICLEVFSEPVSTPCGHNFCKRCICEAWAPEGPCTCPLCNRSYDRRPELSVNTMLRELLSEVKLDKNKSSSMDKMISFSEVQCDVCSEPKLKALKSCLVCLSSFCETHLQLHLTVSGLKRHQLMEPVENLEDRMCPTHQRPLELFCSTDEKVVCMMCSVLEHKNHELLSLEEACESRRSSLLHTQAQSQHMVEQRRLKVQEIQRCVELSDTEVHRERAVGLQAFTDLMQSVQRRQDRFLEELQEKQSRSHKRAQELVQQLEQEICELEKSSTEAERLSRSQDQLHFLQSCPALTPPAGLKEWSSVSFEPETCEGSAARALSELEKHLSENFKQLPSRLELLRVKQFVVDVTLDPDTSHPRLVLSEDLKQVHLTDVKKKLPDSPLRFDTCACVLGKQSFSSGRFYFEVQVKGKTAWTLGVAQESINRKGVIPLSPKTGFWCIVLRNKDQYKACTSPSVPLPLQRAPQKVGVFVDYGEGLVSFYDADSADLLFSFSSCCFREKLFPYFSPSLNYGGSNSAPLVLTAV
ncbi:E3 ubiquitin-protein ligase TRIM39-like isoform X2 [Eucyclogobius newberryi]|uniref:E3 ubiquitin-protein ligase TRIM39-like isoform X2 n=1 Tax=Eucyclogobius newberryi TaxID=166745 RepID=UPI003B59EE6A